ncbi:MAG: efflux transporter periplasmic adaptor subunit [Phyllobacteriaceae bacterium]|nr:efflux transporter periplasmic adaptor subunit [Phyllobacteriaceae bacterium]MBA92223.1 efflux transporter periplasmic adaptor subunit [Phyllobacteriaceae bacterium]
MARFPFHRIAAFVVLAASAAWVATGEFSSVGSAANDPATASVTPDSGVAAERADPPRELKTVAVIDPPFIRHNRAIRISGQTEPDKRAEIATRAAGIIAELPVSQGERVQEGDLILSLDNEGKAAAVESARAVLAQREKEFEASERLARQGSLPKLQLETARSALATARSQLEQAQAELSRFELRAPFSGIIDKVSVELGSSVQQGAAVATLLSLDPVIAAGEVSERDLGHIDIGDTAEIRLISGETVQGTIRYISRQASAATRTFPVEIAIPNPDGAIPAGMTAEITLKTDPVKAVRLPRSVVTLSDSGDLGVRVATGDGKAGFVPIDLVDDTPEGLVLAGVPDDARIIVAGQDLVSDGEQINAVPADMEMLQRLAGRQAIN